MLLKYWARLYLNQTPSEKALEPAIAALGRPYRCQHPFFGQKLFADFALLQDMLIIEVDGDSHNPPEQRKKDLEHMMALKSLGWDTVRVKNEQALANPAGTVRAALAAPRKSLEDYRAALAQLLLDYPGLLEPKAKKSRAKKPRPAVALGTRVGYPRRKRSARRLVQ